MANILADACGGEAIEWDSFSADKVASYDALAFGCPAMGDEELDPDFDWGTGEWMETWANDARDAGVNVVETVVANLEPDDEAEEALKAAAARLV